MRQLKCPLGHLFEVSEVHDSDNPNSYYGEMGDKSDIAKEVSVKTLIQHSTKNDELSWAHQTYFVCPTCGVVFKDISSKPERSQI